MSEGGAAVRWLLGRADSFARDAEALRASGPGHETDIAVLQTLRDELRKVVKGLAAGSSRRGRPVRPLAAARMSEGRCEFIGSLGDQVFQCRHCGAFPEDCAEGDCCCARKDDEGRVL